MPTTPRTTATHHVHAADLEGWLGSGRDVRVLDVRTPAEFESAHIPGAYNVPLDTLGEHADELRRHLDVPVVLVCRSGQRAGTACEELLGTGMDQLHILDGGMGSWDDGHRPVRRGQQRWDLERQVRLVAGAIVLSGVLASTVAPRAKWVSGAVGAGLTFAALSNTCAMGMLLSKLPYNRAASCDVDRVVRDLTQPQAA
ncbi:MAG TPA: rhodanese-like domain-containing protein [Acidimicrobiales bacterium]|nr:rhodanese-like domain-containing protein [Acidimicrobiales bacterium]